MDLYEAQKYTEKKDEEMHEKVYGKMANKNNATEGKETVMQVTKKNTCISPEKEYKGFVTRREFINRTGVFVSTVHFEIIYKKFKELSVSADEFVRDYIDKYSDCIISDRNNLVHFEINDDEVSAVGCYANSVESDELNVLDLLYNMSVSKAKLKSTKPNITETPKHSEVILDYNRFGNIGFSHVHETVDISFLTKKKLTGKITTLFHFLRNTPVTSNRDTGRIATFQIDGRPVISITQKAGDYDNQVFNLTKYKPDGSKQSTRRYSYIKTKNLILDAFGFETQIDEDEDTEQPEESENSNEDMKMLLESENIEDDIDSEYGDIE